jgi:hypothetical protein
MACYTWNDKPWTGPPPVNAKSGDAATECGKSSCVPCVADGPATIDLIANVKQLQQLESALYANMKDISSANPQDVSVQQNLLKRIAGVKNAKQQAFLLIDQRYQDAKDNMAHDQMALDAEVRILQIAEQQLAQTRANVKNSEDYHTTQERIAEIDEYAFESTSAKTSLVYTAFLGLLATTVELFVLKMLPGILAQRNPGSSWRPGPLFETLMTGIVALTIVVTMVYVGKAMYNIGGRSNRVYSQYTFGGLYEHPSGNGSPGESVWDHDKAFLAKLEHDTIDATHNVGASIDSATAAAQAGLAGVAHDSAAAAGQSSAAASALSGDGFPSSHSVANPASSAGAPLTTTVQAHIPGAPPAPTSSHTVENFAAF